MEDEISGEAQTCPIRIIRLPDGGAANGAGPWRRRGWEDLIQARDSLLRKPFEGQAVMALQTLVANKVTGNNSSFHIDGCLMILAGLEKDAKYVDLPLFRWLLPYLRGRLYLSAADPEGTDQGCKSAAPGRGGAESARLMVAETASAGQYRLALGLI
ncbi:hypothetical protein GWK36_12695 [Caldichromatium japonicum]|uniref:Uncharacterized protein n=1 Tax=Caldichromatium japonicum TaxID=2699430 RepID=A0A6G7VFX9_9GAMM|nr:hypothetical protein [Caldichromatium japonicum]QIK38697.1 hypothetical protein GWK36_12695 [Caldichromatium japonicum]